MRYLFVSTLLFLLLTAAKSDKKVYSEKYRPQVHFSPEKDWMFEPDGLIYNNGEYHLFYQKIAIKEKNAHLSTGHAVSGDLLHWTQLPDAFVPDEKIHDIASCRAQSGCALVDSMNVSGLQKNGEKAMLIFFSDNQGNQNLAVSTDKGRNWVKFEGNPILKNNGGSAHDPKVFYHPASGKWVMTLFRSPDNGASIKEGVSFYSSKDLIHWKYESHLEGAGECPDLIEMAVEGEPTQKRWVLTSGEGDYQVGQFDGALFQPDGKPGKFEFGKNFFGAQTVRDHISGKWIQLAWMRGGEYPEMPFNGQLTIPAELSLRKISGSWALCRKPMERLSGLYDKHLLKKEKTVIPGVNDNLLKGLSGDVVHIKASIKIKSADSFGFILRNGKKTGGTDLRYDVNRKTLDLNGTKIAVEPEENGKLEFQILLDKSSIEVFVNHGRMGIAYSFAPVEKEEALELYTQGGEIYVETLEAHTMKSVWTGK
ncbi:MAG: glycoside hydrolase family 32 protein [Marinilabiliales bacterium]|nr:glycoside hydrolase family 32 protein [Marinilabiliales bacterium]